MLEMLSEICDEIVEIEDAMMYGTIKFKYDNLMSAMKPGHPSDILDDIFSEIFLDVLKGDTPSKESLENVIRDLESFEDDFEVRELDKPIKELKIYLANVYNS